MPCAKNWDCSNFVSMSEARHASSLSFSRAYPSFESFESKKSRKRVVLAEFLRLREGGYEEVGMRGVARRAPVRGIFCSASCSLGALAYNSAYDECTRHTISQSRARRVGWSMALASSLLSELEAPFSCTRMTKRRKALIFRRLEASPISANYVRHARKAVPCSSPMNSSTLLKSNSKP